MRESLEMKTYQTGFLYCGYSLWLSRGLFIMLLGYTNIVRIAVFGDRLNKLVMFVVYDVGFALWPFIFL